MMMNQAVDICGRRGSYSVRNLVPFSSVTASPPLQPRNVILPRQHRLPASALTATNRAAVYSYSKLVESPVLHSNPNQDEKIIGEELVSIPHVQTLRQFPREELSGKFVMVRFDSKLLLQQFREHSLLFGITISTVKYLHEAGARITLASSWDAEIDGKILTSESLAGYLSLLLELKVVPVQFIAREKHTAQQESEILLLENLLHFKSERANCKGFAEQLSSGMDIFVNDAFYDSHKSLASTVGISRFCYSCIAGFYFEAGLSQLKHITRTSKRPYMAIVGGANLLDKAAAVRLLVSICDGLVFVGDVAFQIMNALGISVPARLVERGAVGIALALVEYMKSKSREIILPRDFLCINYLDPRKFGTVPATCLLDGWQPVDLGPDSLEEISLLLSKLKKILWIGPVKFGTSTINAGGASKLAANLDCLRWRNNLEVTIVGKMSRRTLPPSDLSCNMIENGSLVWEFLKGRSLPGLMALDRAYPFQVHWKDIYSDPTQPLAVDIGSGNGLFLTRMAWERKDLNFLGLEINGKLVRRCLDDVSRLGLKNGYFIRTNVTATFRSIVSSYPGQLILVTIQCPNPDFNKENQRWRMLQRSLVEAIADLLASGGKVFLQSDIESVAVRMKNEFIKYSKGNLRIMQESLEGVWLPENPFGIRSDWEQHVIDRGDHMYRLILNKIY